MQFDWSTLALQTANVLVLLWLLRRFLFLPVVSIIAARKNAAEKLLADAAAIRDQLQIQGQELARREEELQATGDKIVADARTAAETERAHLLQRTKDEAAQLREAGLKDLARERQQMWRKLRTEAQQLAVTIAARLLGRIPPEPLDAALLRSFQTWLGGLSSHDFHAFAQPGETLEVITAAPLDAQTQASCARMLEQYLGSRSAPRFGIDPSLIAGVEIRGSHGRLLNDLRSDLDRIARELGQDDEHVALA